MGSVGLLFVGAVLFINGAMLLGWVDANAGAEAAPANDTHGDATHPQADAA